MTILILGGTGFVGRAFAEAAAASGHEATVFHRGRTSLPEGLRVEELLGDRDGGLSELGERRWDAVYDSCGYFPRVVGASARALAARTDRYLFVSSISALGDDLSELAPAPDGTPETFEAETYGPLKRACELQVEAALGERSLVVRPGLLVGPNDTTGRLPYWVDRFSRYPDVLVPDGPELPIQLLDARDLASLCVRLLADGRRGTFEAAGEPATFEAVVEACAAEGGGRPVRVPIAELEREGVEFERDFPIFYRGETGLFGVDSSAATAAGMRRRPLRESVADVRAWLERQPGAVSRHGGYLGRDREERLLGALAR